MFSPSPDFMVRVAIAGGTLILGQWFFSEVIHIPGGGLTLLVGGIGFWWLSRPTSPPVFSSPSSTQGWITRCKQVIDQFSVLEDENEVEIQSQLRHQRLEEVLARKGPQTLAVVSSIGGDFLNKELLQHALASKTSITLCWAHPLPQVDDAWEWPRDLEEQDLILYVLSLPLLAADLIWLKQVPDEQAAWVLVLDESDPKDLGAQSEILTSQLPKRWAERLLLWSGKASDLRSVLKPLRNDFQQVSLNLDTTRMRLLSNLHRRWQHELEQLRRQRFNSLQQRTQWLVAGAVFSSPVASVDLLAVVVANGLMIREMAKIWSCDWKPEVLQVVARQLAGAALAQGVVEWSGQALLGIAKVDAGGWMAAGALQALNAAYMTRVVGRSMADWLALQAGVAQPDLEALKRDAPLLVAKAAEQERLDWSGFHHQAKSWLKELNSSGKMPEPC